MLRKRVEINAFAPAITSVNEVVGIINGVKIRIIDTPSLRLDTHYRDRNDLLLLRSLSRTLTSSIWNGAIVTLTHAASPPPDGPSGSSLGFESHPHLKLPTDMSGEDIDSDMDLVDLSDCDGEDEDGYDQLPPFKPLRKSQEIKKRGKNNINDYHDIGEDVDPEDEGPTPVPVPLPDLVLPHSFDSDNHSYSIESNLAVAGRFPGFDIQTIGRQPAYILRSETKLKKFKLNKTSAGISITLLGENVVTGLKIEDQIAVGKRLALVVNVGTVRSSGDTAYGANLECQFSIGRNSKMAIRVGMNNEQSSQIFIKTNSSELQAALIAACFLASAFSAACKCIRICKTPEWSLGMGNCSWLHVSGGALGGGCMVEDTLSIAAKFRVCNL
ncbi:hypothetical protein POTOM_030684 [Populus tomentosa]|uniref:Translocase of chloroplast 159/132 membrane anchor domain-containing protein n=1 Tax=Populus tomentosa TaxID=118781 RepID=A0A8X8CU66_POPTO|nr:hypothetical protein POTOM_030684 [Populus tomentosa]